MVVQSGWLGAVAVISGLLFLTRCNEPEAPPAASGAGFYSPGPQELGQDEPQDAARDRVAVSTYTELNGASGCTVDCSGHDAGFEWAKVNGVTDSADCGGNSASFIEGCEAYAVALEEARDETEYQVREEARQALE